MNRSPPTLSVIVITRNESRNLADCLESVRGLADQLVVVDHGSTDDTVAIARGFGATVEEPPDWPGFGPQKNRALALATGMWVLSLDADERVTPELAREIRTELAAPRAQAYDIPRLSWYCGRFIRHGGWYPDRSPRLFLRGHATFSDDLVHERILVEGPVRALNAPMQHYSYRDFSQVLAKLDQYSTASARQMQTRGRQATLGRAVRHGLWAFVRTYLLRGGFLDGAHGLALAISAAEGSYYRYAKLWLLAQPEVHPSRGTGAAREALNRGARPQSSEP